MTKSRSAGAHPADVPGGRGARRRPGSRRLPDRRPPPPPAPAPPAPPAAAKLKLSLDRHDTALAATRSCSAATRLRVTGRARADRTARAGHRRACTASATRCSRAASPRSAADGALRHASCGRAARHADHARGPPGLEEDRHRPRASRPRARLPPAIWSPAPAAPLVRLLQRGLARLQYATPTARLLRRRHRAGGDGLSQGQLPRPHDDRERRIVRACWPAAAPGKVRHPSLGRHVEADLSQQVLSLVDGDRVVRTYTTSSGAPATPTILGRFRFYSKTPGTNT